MTPFRLAPKLLSLPPILYINHLDPVSSCSKAPWGLSVLSQVTSIFTSTTISPSTLSRQLPNHYAFRAGQNLPDKEFRYLRTVIVTAAVHWGFDSQLRITPNRPPSPSSTGQASAHILHLSVSHRPVFLLNSCLSLFSAAPRKGATLLPKLRGYFAEFLNNSSLARLRILSSSTCVGVRYGHLGSS